VVELRPPAALRPRLPSYIDAPVAHERNVGGLKTGQFTPQCRQLIGRGLAIGSAEADAGGVDALQQAALNGRFTAIGEVG
jgi:hypothetical protein